jgi:SAM-dependent methyltransferase
MRSNREWLYWGRHDPLWAVASLPGRERGAPRQWTADDFLAMGASDFADVARHWTHYGMGRQRCIEIGCGAGRMTKQLLGRFEHVLALDVSPDQVAQARTLLGADAARVEFTLVDSPAVPAAPGSCDAMFSSHVFQHLPGFAAVESYLRHTFAALTSGGTVCFHLPAPGAHRTAEHSALWYAVRTGKIAVKRALGRHDVMEYHRYEPSRVLRVLEHIGYREPELRVFDMRSNGDAHSYYFARRP